MSDRKRRLEIAKSLKELLQSKGKAPSVKYQQTFEELKEASDLVSKELTTEYVNYVCYCLLLYLPTFEEIINSNSIVFHFSQFLENSSKMHLRSYEMKIS